MHVSAKTEEVSSTRGAAMAVEANRMMGGCQVEVGCEKRGGREGMSRAGLMSLL